MEGCKNKVGRQKDGKRLYEKKRRFSGQMNKNKPKAREEKDIKGTKIVWSLFRAAD